MKMWYFVLALLVVVGVYSLVEPYLIKVEKLEIELEGIKGLKIVHLTDLHTTRFGYKEKKVLFELKEINPDYVFMTGDFVDEYTRDLKSCQDFWKELVHRYPGKVFGVTGNHEYQHPETREIISLLEESGIRLLNNESLELTSGNDKFTLAGVKDPNTKRADLEQALPKNGAQILLAHSPEIFREAKEENIGLVLTGHTHGAQINIPLLRWLVLPLRYGKKYREGLFKEQGTYMYVSRGVGTTLLPLRFNAPPEITLIKL